MNINDPLQGAVLALPFTKAADPSRREEVHADDSAQRIPFVRRLPNGVRNHFIAVCGEYVGTVLFLFFALGGTQVANNIPSSAGLTIAEAGSNPQQLQYIALCFGFSLAVNAWVFFRISGGLFNPAVTVGMCLVGAVPWFRGILLFVAQILGGMTAAALISCMFPGPLTVQTTLGGGTTVVQGLFIEMFLTAELVFAIFMLAAEKHRATFIAPVGIGLSLFIAELVGVYFTGGSLNPARSFGPALVNRNFHGYHWIYWVGPMLGSVLAAGFYKFIKALEYETANPDQDSDDLTHIEIKRAHSDGSHSSPSSPSTYKPSSPSTYKPSEATNGNNHTIPFAPSAMATGNAAASSHSYQDFANTGFNRPAVDSPEPVRNASFNRASISPPMVIPTQVFATEERGNTTYAPGVQPATDSNVRRLNRGASYVA